MRLFVQLWAAECRWQVALIRANSAQDWSDMAWRLRFPRFVQHAARARATAAWDNEYAVQRVAIELRRDYKGAYPVPGE